MTQIGIEYQKMKNQQQAYLETARSNLANEEIKWAGLAEDQRYHNLQRQTSLDTAAMNAAASRYASDNARAAAAYSADRNYAASKYHTDTSAATSRYAADRTYDANKYAADQGLQKGTVAGAYEAAGGGFWGGANVLGFLWDTLL